MGGSSSKSSKSSTTEITNTDLPVHEAVAIEDTLPNYPPPRPAQSSKADILTDDMVTIADEVAENVLVEDYETIDGLVKAISDKLTTDLEIARAIFKWIGIQGIKERVYPNKIKLMSPLGYLKQMALNQLSYATMYTVMCRSANIPCVVIRGLAKSASYEVGNQNMDNLRNSWNAVYVAGGWRIVMPLWALSAVVGMRTGAWTLVEAKGQALRAKEEASAGVQVSTINEYFFFTDPDEFVYRCFPDDSKWQLARKPFNKEKYLTVPYLRPAYFLNKLQIVSKFHCILKTENGLCNVTFKMPTGADPIPMSYELFFNHQESKNQIPEDIQLDKYVAIMNEGNKTNFDLRFPVPGIYKLQIVDGKQDWIGFFKIVCGEARKRCEPYPINSSLGFGPSAETITGGLKSESHQKGVIGIRGRKELEITFKLTKPVDVKTTLVHNKIDDEKLAKYVSQKIKNKNLTIMASVPQNGEYALTINTKDKNSSDEFQNVCNYLLTSENVKKKQRDYENPTEKNTRSKLGESLLKSRDPKAIQAALDKFNDLDLEDHGEVDQARDRIEYLSLLQALKTATLRRNIEVLEKAIEDAQNSNTHRDRLQPKIKEAEDVLLHLRELKRFTHEILEMKQTTISELHRYKEPKPIVHDVIKATFLLLGEKEYWVESWPFLQNQMRKTGRESVLYRVKKFNASNMDPDIARKALSFIAPYDKDTVAAASAGAGTFFVWIKHVAGSEDNNAAQMGYTNYNSKQNGTTRYSTPTSLKTSQKFSIGTTKVSQDEQFTRPGLPEEPQYS